MPANDPLFLTLEFLHFALKDHDMLCMLLFDIAKEQLLNNWLEIDSSQ